MHFGFDGEDDYPGFRNPAPAVGVNNPTKIVAKANVGAGTAKFAKGQVENHCDFSKPWGKQDNLLKAWLVKKVVQYHEHKTNARETIDDKVVLEILKNRHEAGRNQRKTAALRAAGGADIAAGAPLASSATPAGIDDGGGRRRSNRGAGGYTDSDDSIVTSAKRNKEVPDVSHSDDDGRTSSDEDDAPSRKKSRTQLQIQ